MRGPQKFGSSSTFYLALLNSVKLLVEDGTNFCGPLRISELYLCPMFLVQLISLCKNIALKTNRDEGFCLC